MALSGDIFGCYSWVVGRDTSIEWVEVKESVKYPKMHRTKGFSDSLVGKESTCNASGDSGLGSSSRGGIGCPLQYSWASLVSQLVKNLPAMRETSVQSLGWEDPLEKGKATPVKRGYPV